MLPPQIATHCAQQHGVVARRQVLAVLPETRADHLLRSGAFERLHWGVARLRGTPRSPMQAAFAAALRAGPSATLTGPRILALLRVPGFEDAMPFEVLTPPVRRLRGVTFRHRRDPDPERAVSHHGEVRIVEPVDALIDAAAFVNVLGARRLRVAWDHLRWYLGVRNARLDTRLARLAGVAPGAGVLGQILDASGGSRIESEGERGLAAVLDCFEPRFEPQVWVTPGRRVDFYSRRVRCAYEYLGRVDHASLADRIADDGRDAELRREGVHVGYVTAADLREPTALLATIAGTLTVRAHGLGVAPPVAVRPLAAAPPVAG